MTAQNISKFSKDLKSKDISIILDSIDKIRDEGNNQSLDILAELYETIENKEVSVKISDLFCDLHNQESALKLVELVGIKNNVKSRKMILSACWQSRLDFSDYLEKFIDIAISEPFELSFEAFTVIENIETKITKNRKTELIKYVNKNLKKANSENLPFAKDMLSIIENYPEIEGQKKLQ